MRLNQELSVASFGNPSVRCTATPSRNGPVEEVWCALLLGELVAVVITIPPNFWEGDGHLNGAALSEYCDT
jgi:hypothetical protein